MEPLTWQQQLELIRAKNTIHYPGIESYFRRFKNKRAKTPQVSQPPRHGYKCLNCGARISTQSKTGLCRTCSQEEMLRKRWKK